MIVTMNLGTMFVQSENKHSYATKESGNVSLIPRPFGFFDQNKLISCLKNPIFILTVCCILCKLVVLFLYFQDFLPEN